MYKPSATYRIQFHKDFRFSDLLSLIPYFEQLGISTIYASPIFKALPGSTHGYDVTDPHQINPEIGNEAELLELSQKLKEKGIGWIQDIVPNHMSFVPENLWLMDVLEKGKNSAFYNFFDICFVNTLEDQRLMVPFLGEELSSALRENKLRLHHVDDKLHIDYQGQLWPIHQNGKDLILDALEGTQGNEFNLKLEQLSSDHQFLQQILDVQYYRLCCYNETSSKINYRRFFTVNSLICMNMDDEQVFETYHSYINQLVQKGVFQGLRIDHVDGLADPETYLQRLRNLVGDDIYIVVEKILEKDEAFETRWPVQGTTGYEFLSLANNLLTTRRTESDFDAIYHEQIGKELDVKHLAYEKKKEILFGHMLGELAHLVELFKELELIDQENLQTLDEDELKNAIAEFLILCPVYRLYINKAQIGEEDFNILSEIITQVIAKQEDEKAGGILLELLGYLKSENPKSADAVTFFKRCMQFSGPLMAKGIEDTLMYTYNRFAAHNEVGDAPDAFGISVADFHQAMMERQETLPMSLNASATHDTKRGEDTRARLNVLSDLPNEFNELVGQLSEYLLENKSYKIHPNDAFLLFQAMVGVMETDDEDLENRLSGFVEKALRETKKRTSWDEPAEDYEQQARAFTLAMLDENHESNQILKDFIHKIEPFAVINSLVQQLLKFTCPGVPDIYQGSELWDFSLVDPDNRRPVDYQKRQQYLEELQSGFDLAELWNERKSGKIKLWLITQLLQLRTSNKVLFEQGEYIPLATKGSYSEHIVAYAKRKGDKWLIFVAGLGMGTLCKGDVAKLNNFDWKDTAIVLPKETGLGWKNCLDKTKDAQFSSPFEIAVSSLFGNLPLAIIESGSSANQRGSGILMPIFSLPNKTGIGDMGKEAYRFVDFLNESRQKYWQLLPLNPVTANQFYSPYSATSAMAGNTLLIDLDWLIKKGWLSEQDLGNATISSSHKVDYEIAEQHKVELLHEAYKNYQLNDRGLLAAYQSFCAQNRSFLDDFAVYQSLKQKYNQLPWNQWDEKFKVREKIALKQYAIDQQAELEEIKWQQFIFEEQWKELRAHANDLGLKLIGDLPFYVGFDSADVWANPHLFKLDENSEMTVVAGVPPDMLSEDGQLWGMPIFNWDESEVEVYHWWKQRIAKNMELFDLLRIDHFRAIHSYWEVPADAKSAKEGKWINGPGAGFLTSICNEFGRQKFLVEDLGGDMEGPIALRDEFDLAGMKVLQFAFGADMPYALHQAHQFTSDNFVVYLGTHDNNTAKGWFAQDLSEEDKKRLVAYLGQEINEGNVNRLMIKFLLSTTAKIAIIQMQDVLSLGADSRMNVPGTTTNNWEWMMENWPKDEAIDFLATQSWMYGRI
jgi:malto-oligosyltrehalose synthase/4-alpha-glucanotransferase